jgi:hypothetical protein
LLARQQEQRRVALSRSGAVCATCGGSIYRYGAPQFAHKLSNSKKNRAKYGSFVIDHQLNGEYTCCLRCNDAMLIDNKPREILKLIMDIAIEEAKKFDK